MQFKRKESKRDINNQNFQFLKKLVDIHQGKKLSHGIKESFSPPKGSVGDL